MLADRSTAELLSALPVEAGVHSNSDIQCRTILKGLEALIGLLERPLLREALNIEHSPETARYEDLLQRIRASLRQYLERRSDLYYIGFVGHFSSGKSSTINSLLSLTGTPLARPVDNNPTDKIITLITHPDNERSIIATASAGRIQIGARYIEHPMLRHVVMADTPGTGDPLLVKDLASEFLPLCDRILFFFSAASPFDDADVPILRETRRRLPFIPLEFVITRLDEYRRDSKQPLSTENLDSPRFAEFVTKVFSRVATIDELKDLVDAPRRATDNRAQYGVDELRMDLLAKADPSEVRARIEMHEHKIQYFRTYATECHAFLSNRIDGRFRDVKEMVDNAEKNISEFEEHVRVSSSKIATSWNDRLKITRAIGQDVLAKVPVVDSPPYQLSQVSRVANILGTSGVSVQHAARGVANRLVRRIASIVDTQVRAGFTLMDKRISAFDVTNATGDEPGLASVPQAKLESGDVDLASASLDQVVRQVRDAIPEAIASIRGDARSLIQFVETEIVGEKLPNDAAEAVQAARSVLLAELDWYYHIVELYRTGVLARRGLDLISRLDVGKELDLSQGMASVEREQINWTTADDLLGGLERAISEHRAAAAALLADSRAAMKTIADTGFLRHSQKEPLWLDEMIATEAESLRAQFEDDVRREVEGLLAGMQKAASAEVTAGVTRYNDKLNELRLERKRRLIGLSAASGVVFTAGALMYWYFGPRETGNSIATAMWLGVLSNLLGDGVGYLVARTTDRFPKSGARLAESESRKVKEGMRAAAEAVLTARGQLTLNEDAVATRLYRFYVSVLHRAIGEDAEQYAASDLKTAREAVDIANVLKGRFEEQLSQLLAVSADALSSAERTGLRIEETAKSIKAKAIDSSFKVLGLVRERTVEAGTELSSVRFV